MFTGVSDDVDFPRIFELSLQPKLNPYLKTFKDLKRTMKRE